MCLVQFKHMPIAYRALLGHNATTPLTMYAIGDELESNHPQHVWFVL